MCAWYDLLLVSCDTLGNAFINDDVLDENGLDGLLGSIGFVGDNGDEDIWLLYGTLNGWGDVLLLFNIFISMLTLLLISDCKNNSFEGDVFVVFE